MRPHSILWYYLWVAPRLLQVLIAGLMVKRRLHRDFPMFFGYTVLQIILGGGLLYLDESPAFSAEVYWRVHYVGLVASSALRFGIIYELFSHVLRRYRTLARVSQVLLRWTAVVLLLVAVLVSANTPVNDRPIFAGINILDRGVDLMQSGLLLFLFVFSAYFRLSWKSFSFGIGLGLGIFATVGLARLAIRIAAGPGPGNYVHDFVSMATYHLCVLIWLAYLLLPEAVGRPIDKLPPHNLEDWNEELHRLLTP